MKMTPDGYFTISLVMSILAHFIFPISDIIPYPYSLAGVILIIAGFLIGYVTNSILLKEKTSIKPFGIPSKFMNSGPFKCSRNPIYLGMAMVLFGLATVLGSISPFMSPIIFVIVMNRSFIPIEENNLEKLF